MKEVDYITPNTPFANEVIRGISRSTNSQGYCGLADGAWLTAAIDDGFWTLCSNRYDGEVVTVDLPTFIEKLKEAL